MRTVTAWLRWPQARGKGKGRLREGRCWQARSFRASFHERASERKNGRIAVRWPMEKSETSLSISRRGKKKKGGGGGRRRTSQRYRLEEQVIREVSLLLQRVRSFLRTNGRLPRWPANSVRRRKGERRHQGARIESRALKASEAGEEGKKGGGKRRE